MQPSVAVTHLCTGAECGSTMVHDGKHCALTCGLYMVALTSCWGVVLSGTERGIAVHYSSSSVGA
jgi:hypothetical protein